MRSLATVLLGAALLAGCQSSAEPISREPAEVAETTPRTTGQTVGAAIEILGIT